MSKKKKAIIAVSVILSSIILIIAVFSVREKYFAERNGLKVLLSLTVRPMRKSITVK